MGKRRGGGVRVESRRKRVEILLALDLSIGWDMCIVSLLLGTGLHGVAPLYKCLLAWKRVKLHLALVSFHQAIVAYLYASVATHLQLDILHVLS